MKFKPKVKPYRHQRRGLVWLWNQKRGGAFFWDPGTGKTKGAYDYVSASYLYRGLRRVLVICPINALQVWDDQADKQIVDSIPFVIHIPQGTIPEKTLQIQDLKWDEEDLVILVVTYSAIIKRDAAWAIMGALQEFDADLVIVDESHRIKGANTKQTKATTLLANRAPKVLLLTGTPLGKNNLDLYAQLKAIDPQIWAAKWTKTGIMSWTNFRTEYGVWGGRTGYELRGYINVDDLERRYKPHVRSARKEDLHDMPQVTDTIIPIDLPPTVQRAYNIFAEEGLIVWKRHLVEAAIPLTKLLRLQQISGGWVHDEQGESVHIHTAKLDTITDMFEDFAAQGKSVVVFARFIAEMDAIYDAGLRSYKDKRYQIRGGVTVSERGDIVRHFQRPGAHLLVLQIGAAEAIDGLQDRCSYGIFYSSDFSLIHWSQARGRLDRSGQREPVTFYHLHARGTVDNLIFQTLRDKKNLEKMVMDNPQILISR